MHTRSGSTQTPSSSRWSGSIAATWLVVIIALGFSVVSFWTVKYLPIQDGPAHIWTVSAWSTLSESSGAVSAHVMENITMAPNWTATLALRGLIPWLDPEVVQTALVTILVVGFVLAMWYSLSSINRAGGALTVLAVPIAAHWYLYRGSFNFAFGVVTLILAIGYWLRRATDPKPSHALGLGALLLATFFSHPIPFMAAVLVLIVLQLGLVLQDHQNGDRVEFKQRFTLPLVASLPSVILLIAYFATSPPDVSGLAFSLPGPINWILSRGSLTSVLESLDISERPWILGLAILLLVAIGTALFQKIKSRQWSWTDGLLVTATLLTIASYVAPANGFGGTSIPDRVFLCALIIALVWGGSISLHRHLYTGLLIGGLLVAFGLTWTRVEAHQRYDAQMNEILEAGEFVGEGSTILPVSTWAYLEPPFHRTMPVLYAASWIATDTGGVDLGNLDPGTDYHPLVWREQLDQDLYDWMARFGPGDITPSRPDGPEPAPGSIDYVLLIGPMTQERIDPELQEWLDDGYTLVFSSGSEGIAHLFESNDQAG